jgi:hypothetical protein
MKLEFKLETTSLAKVVVVCATIVLVACFVAEMLSRPS